MGRPERGLGLLAGRASGKERLGLSDDQVSHSHAILSEYGNMSSATILFVLDRIQQCERPAPGDYGVLMAFGPGLTMEAALLQW